MSTGTTGYRDGQRTSQQQDIEPAWTLTGSHSQPQISPAIFIGNYQNLLITGTTATNSTLVIVDWYADAALTVQTGQALLTLATTLTVPASLIVPALGPYVQLIVESVPGGMVIQPNLTVFLTNSTFGQTAIAPSGLVHSWSGALTANQQLNRAALAQASGRCSIRALAGTQVLKVEVDFLDPNTGNWLILDQYQLTAATSDYRERLLPPHPTRLIVTNGSTTTTSTGNTVVVVQAT